MIRSPWTTVSRADRRQQYRSSGGTVPVIPATVQHYSHSPYLTNDGSRISFIVVFKRKTGKESMQPCVCDVIRLLGSPCLSPAPSPLPPHSHTHTHSFLVQGCKSAIFVVYSCSFSPYRHQTNKSDNNQSTPMKKSDGSGSQEIQQTV